MLSQHLRGHRRRHPSATRACALTAAVLLLLSVVILYSRLLNSSPPSPLSSYAALADPLLDDPPDPVDSSRDNHDLIDELDDVVGEPDPEEEDDDEDPQPDPEKSPKYRFDHVGGVIRRPFDKRSIDQWDDYDNGFGQAEEAGEVVFGSDDVPVDEEVRRKMVGVKGMEDALLLKGSGLREGWGPWFEAKSDFLRRDRMFRSNLEGLNPLNNPMLQDPDGVGVTGLTKGDKLVQKGFLNEFKKVPFLVKKPLAVVGDSTSGMSVKDGETVSMKKPLEVKDSAYKLDVKSENEFRTLENGGEGSVGKSSGASVKDGEKPLVAKDSAHKLELKSKHESKAVEDVVEGLNDRSGTGVIDEPEFRAVEGGLDHLWEKSGSIRSVQKPVVMKDSTQELRSKSMRNEDVNVESKQFGVEKRTVDRRTLTENASNLSTARRSGDTNVTLSKEITASLSTSTTIRSSVSKNVKPSSRIKKGSTAEVYANGKRWGYFPGLHPRLSFPNFMDAFFRKGKCSVRVFMVWNSPPWMFTVRQQRGLESVLLNYRNACLVVFSETIELNFFEGFVKSGFKVAVAMPDLDELLKDTPTHIFASVWYEWRKTRYYSTHYSELVRLAALYKYGGIYLDTDIIVLRPLSSFDNIVALEDQQDGSSLNGAVMSFRKHNPFIMECLKEFYSTYDEAQLRWNGADLLTRVAKNNSRNMKTMDDKMELELQHSSVFFPISRDNISRYFYAPETENERAEQNELFQKIINESFTFHFWNSVTSALVPEPESLVARFINKQCIRCNDVM